MANAKHPDAPWSSREHVFPKQKPAARSSRAAPEPADEDDHPAKGGALRGGSHKVGSRTK